ncbi:MAG: thioredoxin family protein, partial [Bacteroidota bacterium]
MNLRQIIFLLLISCCSMGLEAAGIKFFEGSWDDALAKAKKEKKVVFVDAYTDWCGPCKAMARNTFPNDDVGEFFNKHFINYKYNM